MNPPLPSWPARAFPHEPVHGWFQRLALLNGQISCQTLAMHCGLNGRNLDLAELLGFNAQFPCADRNLLIDATPQLLVKTVRLFGQDFHRTLDFSIRRPRVCPACLREKRYYRSWWDLQVVYACPLHGSPLLDGDGHEKLAWWHPAVGVTPQGNDLALVKADDQSVDTYWEEYLLGRMGLGPQFPAGELDERPIFEIVEVATALGRVAAGGAHSRGIMRHEMRAIYAPKGFRPLVELAASPTASPQTFPGGWTPAASRVTQLLAAMPHNQLAGLALNALERSRLEARVGLRRGRRTSARLPEGHSTVKDAARALGITPKQTRHLAIRLGHAQPITSHAQSYVLSSAAVANLRSQYDGSIDVATAANLLGLSPKDFGDLVDAGLIRPLIRLGGATKCSDRFVGREIHEALAEWRRGATRLSGRSTLFDAFCVNSGWSPGKLAVRIAKGEQPIVAWCENEPGFSGCSLFAMGQRPPRLRAPRRWNGVSVADAAGTLALTPERISILVRAGFLRRLPRTANSASGICPEGLREFATHFATPRAYANLLGIAPGKVRAKLNAAGVEAIARDGLTRLYIVRQADVVRRLGETWDLARPAPDEADDFWHQLRRHLARVGSANRLVGGVGSAAALRSGDGEIVASISVDTCSVKLGFNANRVSSPARFDRLMERFELVRQAWPEATIEYDHFAGEISCTERFPFSTPLLEREAAMIAASVDSRVSLLRHHLRRGMDASAGAQSYGRGRRRDSSHGGVTHH